jgi:hypothetical protein
MISAQGNAAAASRIAQGNAYGGGISSIANWWNQQQTRSTAYIRAARRRPRSPTPGAPPPILLTGDLMPADPSIYSMIRPPAPQPGPLDNFG